MPSDLTVAGLVLPNGKWDVAANLKRRQHWVTRHIDLAHALERRQQPASLLSERRPELYDDVTEIHCGKVGQS